MGAAIADVTDGSMEAELLASIERPRQAAISEGRAGESWASVLAEVRTKSAAIVNEFFRERLLGYDQVRELVEALATEDA